MTLLLLYNIFNSVPISLWLWICANLQKWLRLQHMHWCPCCVYIWYVWQICMFTEERTRSSLFKYANMMSAIEIFAFHIYFMTAFFGVTQAQDLWSNLEFLSPFFYFHLVDRPCLLFLWRVFCIIVFTPKGLPPLSHFSHVQPSVLPWTAACQASLPFTINSLLAWTNLAITPSPSSRLSFFILSKSTLTPS